MPTIITEGGLDTFRALAYDTPTEIMSSHINEMNTQYDRNISSRARQHFDELRTRIAPTNFKRIKQRAVAAMRKAGEIWTRDMVQVLCGIAEFQHTPPVMREYIMAHPRTRKRFYDNQCEGYGELYDDRFKGAVGDDDPVYRSVMTGVLQEEEDGTCFVMDYGPEEEDEWVKELTSPEKFDIIDTWENLDHWMDVGKDDPTSPWNAQL